MSEVTAHAAATSPAVAPVTPDAGAPPPEAATAQQPGTAEATTKTPEEVAKERRAQISAAGRAARRAAAENRELRAKHAQMQQETARANQRVQEVGASERQLQQLARENPIEFARRFGLAPKDVIEAAQRDATPEGQMRKAIDEARAEAKRANDALEAMRSERTQAEQATALRNAQQDFQTQASDAEKYPFVSSMPDGARMSWARDLVAAHWAEVRNLGLDPRAYPVPTNLQLLQHMEKLARSTRGALPKAATESTPAASPSGSATPQTVTSAQTSAKYSLPANFDQLSDAQQKKHMANMIREMRGKKPV